MVTWYPRSLWSTRGLNSQLVYEARPEEGPPVPTKGSRALLPQRRCGEAGRPLGGALGGERRRKREKWPYDSRFRSSSSASQATLPNPRSALLTQRPERNSKRFLNIQGYKGMTQVCIGALGNCRVTPQVIPPPPPSLTGSGAF